VRVEPLPDGRVCLTNKSRKLPIRFSGVGELERTGSRDLGLPVILYIGRRKVEITSVVAPPPPDVQSLLEAPLPPGAEVTGHSLFSTVAAAAGVPEESLIRWLQGAMDVLHSAVSSADFFDRAAGALVDMVGLDTGRVLILEGKEWRVQALRTAPNISAREWKPSTHVLAWILAEKRTSWQTPLADTQSLAGVLAVVAAPILDPHGEVIGVLYGERTREGGGAPPAARPVRRLEAMLVELLASGVAAGLARLEQEKAALEGHKKLLRMERDMEIGRNIQAGFLPEELPRVAGWEVAAYFRPAREVGGDFYDVFGLPHDHLALVIADVCDKGVGAALYMTLFRSLIRAFSQQTLGRGMFDWATRPASTSGGNAAQRRSSLLADLLALSTVDWANNYVARTHERACMFATMFFGVLDTRTGALSYVNAGHDPPVVVGASGVKGHLDPTGLVVGMRPNVAYDVNHILLEPGDALVMYTDGVTEARDPARQFFTEKRLLSLLDVPAPPAAALLDGVIARLQEHVAGAEPSDDVTLLAVRRSSAPPPAR
jgi:sigma-B regulation protein RsbU (phosphoserine phosphatase)